MTFIIELLITAGVLLLVSYFMPQIEVKNYGKALLVAFLIGVLNATIGALIRFPINLVTLWLLDFLVRLLVTAIIIKIVDKLMTSFTVHGFMPALILAVILALTGSLTNYIFGH